MRRILPAALRALSAALLAVLLLGGCGAGPVRVGGDSAGVDVSAAPPPPDDARMMPAIMGPPPDPPLEELVYRIGPDDQIDVSVFGVPELSAETQVNLQGLVALPLLGPVYVSGLTPREAEQEIERILASRYLRDPRVTVYVKDSASLNVTISGAVGSPGVKPIRGRTTLSDALAQSGGVSPVGKKHQVVLYRGQRVDGLIPDSSSNPPLQAYVVDYQKIITGRMRDPLVIGGDKVYVPPSGLAVFFSPVMNILQTWVWPYRPL